MFSKSARELAAELTSRIDREKGVIKLDGLDCKDVEKLLQYISVKSDDTVEYGYPQNLFEKIFGYCDTDGGALTRDQEDGLEYALSTLKERERYVIRLRYRDDRSLQETGNNLNLSREGARQIEEKAVRKLRDPARKRYIQHGYLTERINQLTAQEKRLEAIQTTKLKKLQKEHEKQAAVLIGTATEEGWEDEVLASTKNFPVEDLGLSVRAWNCLRRSELWTLQSLREQTLRKMERIRNLGRGSLNEIVQKVRAVTGEDIMQTWRENEEREAREKRAVFV